MFKRIHSAREILAIRMAIYYLSDPFIGYRGVAHHFHVSKTQVYNMFQNVLPTAYDKLAKVVASKAFNRSPNYVLLKTVGITQEQMPVWKADRSQAAVIAKAKGIIDGAKLAKQHKK